MAKKTASKEKKKKTKSNYLFAVNLLEKLVDLGKNKVIIDVLRLSLTWISKVGHFGLIAAAALGFLFMFIVAIRLNSFNAFLTGLAWVVLVFVIQYTAHKFSTAGETLIINNPTLLSSKAFLRLARPAARTASLRRASHL